MTPVDVYVQVDKTSSSYRNVQVDVEGHTKKRLEEPGGVRKRPDSVRRRPAFGKRPERGYPTHEVSASLSLQLRVGPLSCN